MSEFTREDFQAVAIAVADHIAKQPVSALLMPLITPTYRFDYDRTWENNKARISEVLNKFESFFILFGDDDKSLLPLWNGSPSFFLEVFDNDSEVCCEPRIDIDPSHPMNDATCLNRIFDSFFIEYSPPEDHSELHNHLWALQLYYTEIVHLMGAVHEKIPTRIDAILNMVCDSALQKIGEKRFRLKQIVSDKKLDVSPVEIEREAEMAYNILTACEKDCKREGCSFSKEMWAKAICQSGFKIFTIADLYGVPIHTNKKNKREIVISRITQRVAQRLFGKQSSLKEIGKRRKKSAK